MPTFDVLQRFFYDYRRLSPEQQRRFREAKDAFVQDLENKHGQFRRSLRVKRVHGTAGVYEMTWAPNGRATFQFGENLIEGEPHIIWRRVGTHGIFSQP